ncbi:mitochondrial fission ELM1 family protein [Alphaproteobacteria bacterium]|nr:mitochondrial fission ELM1 family protein [Alphaproteobacteria bacterium]
MQQSHQTSAFSQAAQKAPPTLILFDEHKVGTAKQCLALASALNQPLDAHPVCIKKPWSSLPTWLWPSPRTVLKTPLPDILPGTLVIGGGRRSAGILAALKKEYGEEILTIQIFKGDQKPHHFDTLIAPKHDNIKVENLCSVTGALVWMDRQKIADEGKKLRDKYHLSATPYLGVLVGGSTAHFKYTKRTAHYLCQAMNRWMAKTGGKCLITTSRRTPSAVNAHLMAWAIKNECPLWVWGDGENPYTGILGAADQLLVTEDSISMATECAYLGKPLYIFRVGQAPKKFKRFYTALIHNKHAALFQGAYHFESPRILDEGQDVAHHLHKTYPVFFQKHPVL